MAKTLDINKCWFHKNHYDIPKKRIEEIEKKCRIIDTRLIVDIIKRPDLADDLICEKGDVQNPKDYFMHTQMTTDGHNENY